MHDQIARTGIWCLKYTFNNLLLKYLIISIQFKALFRVDIHHTYNTSSNELLKSTRLDPATRNNAIGRLQGGQSQTEVDRQFKVHQSSILHLWQRLNQTGSAEDRPRQFNSKLYLESIYIIHITQALMSF
jgi:hypothetical protein